ncbi:MAG: phosphoserine transaminase [Pseudomonadota bacterium]
MTASLSDIISQPEKKPGNPNFSSGPCSKFKGWSLDLLKDAPLGRSHRAKIGKNKLKAAIDHTKTLLKLPEGYRVGIVAGSDTGAVEIAMWSLLGARAVDVLAWESFSKDWVKDITEQLKLDANIYQADYGEIPDLKQVNQDNDIVFAWNGTTSGVRVPDADWIRDDRKGLTICDATSAIFAQTMDWTKLDVITYSWQKVLGGEAAHGILILSPRAVERLESYVPEWPLPKIFRLTKKGKLNEAIFEGATINTPSMLCVEDYLAALNWAEGLGGYDAMVQKADVNLAVIEEWVADTEWIDFLAKNKSIRSNSSVCLKITDPGFMALDKAAQLDFCKQIAAYLESLDIAYDINGYRDAPAGLRIWCGATIEADDLRALCPWITYAYHKVRTDFLKAAA